MFLGSQSLPDAPSLEPVAGDPEEWVRSHGGELLRRAVAVVRDHAVAEDLVQETFLAAWKNRDRFEGRSSEKTWLLRILRNKIADYYRENVRNIQFEDMEALAEFETAQFRSGLGGMKWARPVVSMSWHHVRESLERGEFWDTAHQCAGKLPEKVARVFLLREVEQWGTERICETMNIERTHLFVMLHRARLALRH